MRKVLDKLAPIAKAVAGAVIGAVLPLVSVSLVSGFDWKAILSAAVGAAVGAIGVYLTPNRPAPPPPRNVTPVTVAIRRAA